MVYVIHPQIEEPKIAHCECKVMPPVLIRPSDSVWLFFSAFFWGQIPAEVVISLPFVGVSNQNL